jgi:two-component sensor histidine kinase
MLETSRQVGKTPRNDALLTLVETIEALASARSIDAIATVVRSAARRISGADGVAFVLRDDDQCYYVDEDAIGPLWKGRRFPMRDCISGWAMHHRETVVIPDIYRDDRVPHAAYRPTFVKSLVMVPVRREDPIGAIGAYWGEGRHPSEEAITRLEVMARATATAIDSALMHASLTEALERRQFLLRELDHRCKNTLAAVQSIADQTLRRSASPQGFVEAFNGRLGALARAHELLTRRAWGRASLAEVVSQALAPFGAADGGRIHAEGPEVTLAPETAVAMHMTLHELAVNAAKHGALSTPSGQVSVAWRVGEDADAAFLTFTWVERGGPVVAEPVAHGFGLRLLERGITRELDARSEIAFEPGGLSFALRAPLSGRLALAQ